MRRIAIAAAVSGAVFFLLSPFILVEPGTALRDIRANRQIVVDRAVENLGLSRRARPATERCCCSTRPARSRRCSRSSGSASPSGGIPARALAARVPGSVPAVHRRHVPGEPLPRARRPVHGPVRGDRGRGDLAHGSGWRPSCCSSPRSRLPGSRASRTDAFIRQTDTRTLALDYIRAHIPAGATILTQPYSVPLEPTADVLREAVSRSGTEMPTKTSAPDRAGALSGRRPTG